MLQWLSIATLACRHTHRALAVNEMTSPDWNASAAPYGPANQALGTFVLQSRGILTDWCAVVGSKVQSAGACSTLTPSAVLASLCTNAGSGCGRASALSWALP